MFELDTQRLRIIPLTLEQLKIYKENHNKFEKSLGLNLTEKVELDRNLERDIIGAWDFWFDKVEKNPFSYTWYTRWEIILKDENRIIGTCGFKGMPDEKGEIEVGYFIHPAYQNKGYMTEALKEMIRYAFLHPGVKTITAETPTDNFPSQQVLIKNGFNNVFEKNNYYYWKLSRSF